MHRPKSPAGAQEPVSSTSPPLSINGHRGALGLDGAGGHPYIMTPIAHRPERKNRGRFQILQSWEGRVIRVDGGNVWARLVDKTNGGTEEEAQFFLDDITDDDRPLVEPGAVFYWSIGYSDSVTGERSKTSLIRFRRLPAWSRKALAALENQVSEIVGEPEREADAAG
jgi:hypothetical protein